MDGKSTASVTALQADDDQLVRLAQQDATQFAPLYDRYFERVYRYCLRRVSDAQLAEDLCSEIFIKVMDNLHRYQDGVFAAWLFRIAHNTVVSHYRQQREHIALDKVILPDEHNSIAQMTDSLFVQEILQSVSDEEAELLALRLDAEMSAQEIGAVIGKSANAVRVQIHRVFTRLRARYGNDHSGGEA